MRFAVVGLNHNHVYAILSALLSVHDVELAAVVAAEDDLVTQFHTQYPDVPRRDWPQVLADSSIELVACVAINADRGPLAVEALQAGKHVLVDKPAVTTLADLEAVEAAVAGSRKRWFVSYNERLGSPPHERLRELMQSGTLGRIATFVGLGGHRLAPATRAPWTYDRQKYGGIINDVGSHQIELFRWLTGEQIVEFRSRIGNLGTPEHPDFEDFGDVSFQSERGIAGYVQLHWLTPEPWVFTGDRRQFVVGTKGSAEVRGVANLGVPDESPVLVSTVMGGPTEVFVSPGFHNGWAEAMIADIREGKDRWMPQQFAFDSVRTVLKMEAEAQWISTESR